MLLTKDAVTSSAQSISIIIIAMGAHGVLDEMINRYITNFTHAYFIGVVMPCSASVTHGVQWAFEGLFVQNLVQLVILDSVQCRPIPCPSFSGYTVPVHLTISQSTESLGCIQGCMWRFMVACLVDCFRDPHFDHGLRAVLEVMLLQSFSDQIALHSGLCSGLDLPDMSLSFYWDPGGAKLFHWLGGKPKLKKGGMSAYTLGLLAVAAHMKLVTHIAADTNLNSDMLVTTKLTNVILSSKAHHFPWECPGGSELVCSARLECVALRSKLKDGKEVVDTFEQALKHARAKVQRTLHMHAPKCLTTDPVVILEFPADGRMDADHWTWRAGHRWATQSTGVPYCCRKVLCVAAGDAMLWAGVAAYEGHGGALHRVRGPGGRCKLVVDHYRGLGASRISSGGEC
jgi:hypothetical protein